MWHVTGKSTIRKHSIRHNTSFDEGNPGIAPTKLERFYDAYVRVG